VRELAAIAQAALAHTAITQTRPGFNLA
jgi:hypothetical protein